MTLWTVARQAPLSMGYSRQEYWSGLPLPSPGDLPHPGIKPMSLMSPALAVRLFTTSDNVKSNLLLLAARCVLFFFFFLIFIGAELIYNAVLVSGVSKANQLYINVSLLFFRFFSHIGHYRLLCRVPCAVQ